MIDLNPLENDAMLEVFNIAMGMAGSTLSQMVDDEVTLQVPSIKFFTVEELLKNKEIMTDKPLVAVIQRISGVFNSDAVLMFTEDDALYVVQQMMNEDFDEILPANQFSEIQQEAMIEIGNVVLNACIASIANMFQIELNVS
ncbi:MAG: chemotaxis protein CheC, partial [Candidatus Electrothrix sp. ATG2]|nr:chemotaxis protein CheC [Candidatus Electrothrix sp. ATG2]